MAHEFRNPLNSLFLSTDLLEDELEVTTASQMKTKISEVPLAVYVITREEIDRYTYQMTGPKAVEHLFRVASGLDSLVLGEPQIMGQLKNAYAKALEAGADAVLAASILHDGVTTVGSLKRRLAALGAEVRL